MRKRRKKIMKANIYLTMLAVTAGIAVGCNNNTPPPSQDAANAAQDSAAQTKDQFVASMDKRMVEMDVKIDRLASKAANATGDAKAKADQALADLRPQRDAVKKQYDDLKASGQDVWTKTKAGFQSAWDGLVKAYDNTAAKINGNP
jgi:hypothetical protein